jgi:Ca2+-dependent lipid-binding protein
VKGVAPLLEFDGILRLEVVKGWIVKNSEVWGMMDPYVELKYQKIKYRSRVHGAGGSKPVWNQSFDILIVGKLSDIQFQLFHEDVPEDDEIGSTKFPVNTILSPTGVKELKVPVYSDGSQSAEILIKTQLISLDNHNIDTANAGSSSLTQNKKKNDIALSPF